MLRISVNANRKVAGAEPYSSDGFHCQLDLEVADSLLGSPELSRQIDHLYRIALDSVDQQIRKQRAALSSPPKQLPAPAAPRNGHGPQNPDHLPATERQIRFIEDLADQLRLVEADLADFCRGCVNQPDWQAFTREQASRVIEELRSRTGKPQPTPK